MKLEDGDLVLRCVIGAVNMERHRSVVTLNIDGANQMAWHLSGELPAWIKPGASVLLAVGPDVE